MNGLVAVKDWLGHHGEPLEPEKMQFRMQEGKSCRNCLFDGQKHAICVRAGKADLRAGLEDCGEAAVIYVLSECDPRQLTIEVNHGN